MVQGFRGTAYALSVLILGAGSTCTAQTSARDPAVPMSIVDALHHWDGEGELLLKPSDPETYDIVFSINAAFDRSDITKAAPADDVANNRLHDFCLLTSFAVVVHNGQFISSATIPPNWKIRIGGSGSGLVAYGNNACRTNISRPVVKIREGDQWTLYVHPPLQTPQHNYRVVGAWVQRSPDDARARNSRRMPAEIMGGMHAYPIGRRLPEDIGAICPKLFGLMLVSPNGLSLQFPWFAEPPITPGVRRDPEARATTLILQNATCRIELEVSREILVDGVWKRSALAPLPGPKTTQE